MKRVEYKLKFSERLGFVTIDDVIQLNTMNSQLKNDIFNFCMDILFNRNHEATGLLTDSYNGTNYEIVRIIWTEFFHFSIGTLIFSGDRPQNYLGKYYSVLRFYEIYDFFEYIIQTWTDSPDDILNANRLLSKNHSGYRFINRFLTPINSDTDIKNIKSGLESKIDGGHLQKAINELGKRSGPNFDTVMLESINAVEVAARTVCIDLFDGRPSDILSKSIQILKRNNFIEIHPAYLEAISKLYAYTSDNGIRHGKDPQQLKHVSDQAETIFMLEICSAFISMLKTKLSEYPDK